MESNSSRERELENQNHFLAEQLQHFERDIVRLKAQIVDIEEHKLGRETAQESIAVLEAALKVQIAEVARLTANVSHYHQLELNWNAERQKWVDLQSKFDRAQGENDFIKAKLEVLKTELENLTRVNSILTKQVSRSSPVSPKRVNRPPISLNALLNANNPDLLRAQLNRKTEENTELLAQLRQAQEESAERLGHMATSEEYSNKLAIALRETEGRCLADLHWQQTLSKGLFMVVAGIPIFVVAAFVLPFDHTIAVYAIEWLASTLIAACVIEIGCCVKRNFFPEAKMESEIGVSSVRNGLLS